MAIYEMSKCSQEIRVHDMSHEGSLQDLGDYPVTPMRHAQGFRGLFYEQKREPDNGQLDKDQIISAPLDYLLSSQGKNIRTKLIAAFNQWLQVPEEKLEVINRVVELLHTASLLIDDIQDSSQLRRGQPVAHSIFGVAQTINSANYAYFAAQKKLELLENPKAFSIFTEELLSLHRGQGMDLYWRDSLICPTEEEYLEMVSNKTGGLFRLAVRLMQLESKQDKDYVPLVDLLGITFQIRDDYQNLWSGIYTDNKGFCEDITEGKFSFPIIYSIRSNPKNPQLLNILRQKSSDDAVKKFARKYMESTGSPKYCRQKISALIKLARGLVEELNGDNKSAEMEAILDYLEFE
ncbi:putative geranylgeranyl pyrophosphate synthase [Talaromyces proteolyticus]|uniref:(2E,6E)-farnesyl diphosphate synthase n=1 Tax=Talaromyces proteolyticus TaxID=1131652 RepID=A0AAD4Q1P5_9EURO|nr:putative geranylgeranyl pyrophosphate synthase [Talaromyces proteolyticus]KAH8705865.1 putative geranylgeranyl pyrophosphate synthase [Talaromyces proteolyticus]